MARACIAPCASRGASGMRVCACARHCMRRHEFVLACANANDIEPSGGRKVVKSPGRNMCVTTS
eukprot:4742895-Alexandrium_andersonii.AAC.1